MLRLETTNDEQPNKIDDGDHEFKFMCIHNIFTIH